MRNTRCGWIAICALAIVTIGCRPSSLDWTGTWKLSPSQSNYWGPIITISISADGEYHYDDGTVRFAFRCDGNYRPTGNNRTEACVKSTATTLDLIRRVDGVKTNASQWELSDAGKVLTATATAFRPGGPVVTARVVASRISGANGFAGQWLDRGYLQRHSVMTLRLDNQTLHIGYPSGGEYVDAPIDGADAAVHGPHVLAGVTYAVRPSGQRGFLILVKRNGKVLDQESLELSNDGKTITESWWNRDRPADKGALVYEKQ